MSRIAIYYVVLAGVSFPGRDPRRSIKRRVLVHVAATEKDAEAKRIEYTSHGHKAEVVRSLKHEWLGPGGKHSLRLHLGRLLDELERTADHDGTAASAIRLQHLREHLSSLRQDGVLS